MKQACSEMFVLKQVWYNPEGHHSMPAYLNSLNNFLLRSNLPPEKRQKYGQLNLSLPLVPVTRESFLLVCKIA